MCTLSFDQYLPYIYIVDLAIFHTPLNMAFIYGKEKSIKVKYWVCFNIANVLFALYVSKLYRNKNDLLNAYNFISATCILYGLYVETCGSQILCQHISCKCGWGTAEAVYCHFGGIKYKFYGFWTITCIFKYKLYMYYQKSIWFHSISDHMYTPDVNGLNQI